MSSKAVIENSDQITILRIKRKRNEEPLDALRMFYQSSLLKDIENTMSFMRLI